MDDRQGSGTYLGPMLCKARSTKSFGSRDCGHQERLANSIAPLYVKGVPKDREFRIHVVSGRVIDHCRKIARPGTTPTTWDVRSHDNGFIFCRNSGSPSEEAQQVAINAVAHYGLDFGGVDVAVTSRGVPYVLEINTVPGIEGQSVQKYKQASEELLRET